MKISVSNEAVNWYKEQLSLENGDYLRFFVRYGGCSTVQKGFSLGVNKERPTNLGAKIEIDGITFFIDENDLWYFENHDIHVDYDSDLDEPIFEHQKSAE